MVVLYSALAIVGGMAYEDFYDGDETLFSKLNGSGNNPAKVTQLGASCRVSGRNLGVVLLGALAY